MIIKAILLFILTGFSAWSVGSTPEVRKVRYNIYLQTCKQAQCKETKIRKGKVEIKIGKETDDLSWGIVTENLNVKGTDYKLIVSLSKDGKDKYRFRAQILKSSPGTSSVFSSATVVSKGYAPGLELILEPTEEAGPQTRASLILQ